MPMHDALSCTVTMYFLYGVRLTIATYGSVHNGPTAQLNHCRSSHMCHCWLSWAHAVKISRWVAHVAVRYISLSCPALGTAQRAEAFTLYKTPQFDSPNLKLFLARQARAAKGITSAAAPKLQVPIQVEGILWGSPQCQAVWAAELEEIIASQCHASLVPGPHLSFWLHSTASVSTYLRKSE